MIYLIKYLSRSILLIVVLTGCLAPQTIEPIPSKKNQPPKILSYSPQQSYVILLPGEEMVFSINKVQDEDPQNLSYIWYLNKEPISNGTFIRFVAPPLPPSENTAYYTLKVVISDGEYETDWWWTIIVTSS